MPVITMAWQRRHSCGSTGLNRKPHHLSSSQDNKENFIRRRLYSDPGVKLLVRRPSASGVQGSQEEVEQVLLAAAGQTQDVRRRTSSVIVGYRAPDQRISESHLVASVFARHRITPRSYAHHRYADALQTVIPKVFNKIFFLKYRGSPSVTLEKHLIQSLGYTKDKLKSVFGTYWKKKIKVIPCELPHNDVSLWYKLLHVGCNLAPPDSSSWHNSTSLEHILWKLKEMRNSLVHGEIVNLSPQEYLGCLQDMRDLCVSAVEAASDGSEDLSDFQEMVKNDIGQYELDIAQVVNEVQNM